MNPVQIVRNASETRLEFEPVLAVAGARDLYRELDGALERALPVVLDASRVERVDGAALQVVAAFVQAARTAGLDPRWQGASPALRNAAVLLDLSDFLGGPA